MGDSTKDFCSILSLAWPGSWPCLDTSLRLQNAWLGDDHDSWCTKVALTLFLVFLLHQRSAATSNWFLKKPHLMTNFWTSFCIHFHVHLLPTHLGNIFILLVRGDYFTGLGTNIAWKQFFFVVLAAFVKHFQKTLNRQKITLPWPPD